VEDQQPAAGDLTVDADTATDATETAEAETDAVAAEEADGDAEATDEADATEVAEGEAAEVEADDAGKGKKAKKARRTRNKKPRAARTKPLIGKRTAVGIVVAASLLFVGSAGFAGATMHKYLSERAAVETKLKVARTAANAITTLWSYTPENMDTLADRAANYLSGDFAAQYRKFVDAIVAPNKQAKISSHTQVVGAAVETLDGPNAIAIVYTNTTSISPLNKNIPALKYLSYRVILKRDGGRWLVTRMTTVTSLDLTPHL
jgi:Mce-associated membrane protein